MLKNLNRKFAEHIIKPTEYKQTVCLTVGDIKNHVSDMYGDGERFVIKPAFREKAGGNLPSYLMCGNRYYALAFDYTEAVYGFVLRMSEEMAESFAKRYKITPAMFGSDWHILILNVFEKKEEVFRILDKCYDYTLREYYTKAGRMRAAANDGQVLIENLSKKAFDARYVANSATYAVNSAT